MAIERTLALVKPDGVRRQLIGEVIRRYEQKGLLIVGLLYLTMSREVAERFYAEHRQQDWFQTLLDIMTCGPIVAIILEGESAVGAVRHVNGPTDPLKANPGTIRGDLGTVIPFNVVHGSDSVERAAEEVKILFDQVKIEALIT